MTVDLSGWNNEYADISFTIPEVYRARYDLDLCTFEVVTRRAPDDEDMVDRASTANGRCFYAAGVLTVRFPQASVEGLSGAYSWDFRFTTQDGISVRVEGGTRTIKKGTAR